MSVSSQGPTETEWDFFRSAITTFYLGRGLTLEEVRREMEQNYGFKATRKMYNTRIRNWRIKKNVTAAEKQRIADELVTNKPAGILRIPVREGRPFTRIDKIDRYMRTQKLKVDKDCSNHSHAIRNQSCGGHIIVNPATRLRRRPQKATEPPEGFFKDWLYSLIPKPSPLSYMSLSLAETFLHCWKEETCTWICSSSATTISLVDEYERAYTVNKLYDVRQAMRYSRLQDCECILTKFCEKAKNLLRMQYWPFLSELAYFMYPCWWDGFSEHRTYIQGFLVRMAIVIYGEVHARTRLLESMLDAGTMRETYGSMLKVALNTVMEHNHVHSQDLEIMMNPKAHLLVESVYGPSHEGFSFPEIINSIEQRFGLHEASMRTANFELAGYYAERRDYGKAKEIIESCLSQCTFRQHGHGDARENTDPYSGCVLLTLINVYGTLGLLCEAEEYSRFAVDWCRGCDKCEEILGEAIAFLEEILLRKGNLKEAETFLNLLHSTDVRCGYYYGLRLVEWWPG